MIQLFDHQLAVLSRLRTGCVLNGGVGSGKSLTSVAYYYLENGGGVEFLNGGLYSEMKNPKDLYIITTAMKRDKHEWDKELSYFLLSTDPEINFYSNKVVVDSWNNIGKYVDVRDAFFIFDEQRLVGYGAWAKSFLKIARRDENGKWPNEWLLLTGTPGDTMMDYMTLFIANGWFRNKTDFITKHVVYDPRSRNYPKILRYSDQVTLYKMRRKILVDMDFKRETCSHHIDIPCDYDRDAYKTLTKKRWNPEKNQPIESIGELCYLWRKVCNADESRQIALMEIFEEHPRMIVFYNFDYELDILRECFKAYTYGEWNGHKHDPLPTGQRWAYLVQYTAGCEGWDCITTDTTVFYSPNYSYKVMTQAAGRIDRAITPYTDLYYYHLRTNSPIDTAIKRAYLNKKSFNESLYLKK